MTPTLELQRTIVAELKAAPALAALVADRVYDRPPQGVAFPYVSIGPFQQISDDADCLAAFEVFVDVHCWSRAYGSVECKQMTSAVVGALHEADLTLNGATLVEMRHRSTQEITDRDGETTHGISTFRALIDMA